MPKWQKTSFLSFLAKVVTFYIVAFTCILTHLDTKMAIFEQWNLGVLCYTGIWHFELHIWWKKCHFSSFFVKKGSHLARTTQKGSNFAKIWAIFDLKPTKHRSKMVKNMLKMVKNRQKWSFLPFLCARTTKNVKNGQWSISWDFCPKNGSGRP